MVVDHIGVVVKSLESATRDWKDLFGYEQMTEPVVNTRQKVKVVFLQKAGSTLIKLIEPTDPTSPVFGLASRGGGLHHLCFKTNDVQEAIRHLEKHSSRLIVPPQPGEAFENEPIAFLYTKNGLPIEVIGTDKKANRKNRRQ